MSAEQNINSTDKGADQAPKTLTTTLLLMIANQLDGQAAQ